MAVPPTTDFSDRHQLRTEMRSRRADYVRTLTPVARAAAEAAMVEHVVLLLGGHRTIASYRAIGDEIDPQCLAGQRLRTIGFPRVNGRDVPLTFHAAVHEDMVPGWSNIPEPRADAALVIPTALLIPLLAVDPAGNRLGHGGGHYDRTLAALGPVLKIGIAWDVQLIERLTAEPWDIPLDWIVTPSGPRQVERLARGA